MDPCQQLKRLSSIPTQTYRLTAAAMATVVGNTGSYYLHVLGAHLADAMEDCNLRLASTSPIEAKQRLHRCVSGRAG